MNKLSIIKDGREIELPVRDVKFELKHIVKAMGLASRVLDSSSTPNYVDDYTGRATVSFGVSQGCYDTGWIDLDDGKTIEGELVKKPKQLGE